MRLSRMGFLSAAAVMTAASFHLALAAEGGAPAARPPVVVSGPNNCGTPDCGPPVSLGSRFNLPPVAGAMADGTYLYVTTPGTGGGGDKLGGVGIAVFDADHDYKFVKRIPYHYALNAEPTKGVSADAASHMMWVTTPYRVVAIDLLTDRSVWENSYDGYCCDRGEVSPDGKILWLAGMDDPRWLVVDAKTGNLITTVVANPGARGHNTIFSPTGKAVYLSPSDQWLYVADPQTNKVVRKIGPFSGRIRPFVLNGKETRVYASIDGLEGVAVADAVTGKILGNVPVPNMPCLRGAHANCVHGVALTQDEKEVWVSDTANGLPGGFLHVFDNTGPMPKFKLSIPTRTDPGWITCSIDGKRMYPASGEIIDRNTHKALTVLTDEKGRGVASEKMMEVRFKGGKVSEVGNQWCNGTVGAPAKMAAN